MKRDTLVWTVLLVLGAAGLIGRWAMSGGFGTTYVKAVERRFVEVETPDGPSWIDYDSDAIFDHAEAATPWADLPADRRIEWTRFDHADQRDYVIAEAASPGQDEYRLSLPRTLGLWIAAFFTLAIFSFLYKDNPFYKVAESVVVGVSAAYWMVVGYWEVIIPNLVGKLAPGIVRDWSMPGLDAERELIYIVPLILGVMLVWRLAPKGTWISRWPLAFIIGTTAGIRLVGFIHADFLSQIRNSIVPVLVMDSGFDFWESLRNVILVVGVLTCLVYFFFSFEHKGVVGQTARVGIWFLMITFGAAFGYTVMGRIALLAIRIEFLFDDWLWLIDPTGKRLAAALPGMLGMG